MCRDIASKMINLLCGHLTESDVLYKCEVAKALDMHCIVPDSKRETEVRRRLQRCFPCEKKHQIEKLERKRAKEEKKRVKEAKRRLE